MKQAEVEQSVVCLGSRSLSKGQRRREAELGYICSVSYYQSLHFYWDLRRSMGASVFGVAEGQRAAGLGVNHEKSAHALAKVEDGEGKKKQTGSGDYFLIRVFMYVML
ncbi:hypothetical protein P9G84_09780 [Brevibacillus centrosporus]|uniref:hypothetical protein n=1 Tax=Brevibacillus centrosporus TaxID=54910 RepID=UPI000F09E3FD|nr:hypothetical protein [Brevibacillus centrosporus]MEC2129257.1 hypothetical protein [Brevibacillus centrosporus]RNB70816.1 hypothetical protein EDM55_10345 [Brevibacillus centrosporus]GED34313.1 hypothetical protein BCE02nite_54540 [Brevibacillus centrosporus]